MKWKKIFIDPSFWILLIANSVLVYKYEQNPGIFTTLIWLYWSQNILYAFFNFFDIITTRFTKVPTASDPQPSSFLTKGRVVVAFSFLFHFGFFHVVYMAFLFSMDKTGPFDVVLYKNYLLVFLLFQMVSFIQHKIQNKKEPANLGRMFFMPYLRVIPMHLCILVPAFLHITGLTVFLVIKVIADMITYLMTTNYYHRGNAMAEVTTANLQSALSSE